MGVDDPLKQRRPRARAADDEHVGVGGLGDGRLPLGLRTDLHQNLMAAARRMSLARSSSRSLLIAARRQAVGLVIQVGPSTRMRGGAGGGWTLTHLRVARA